MKDISGSETTRRIRPPQPVHFYELEEWDGADGRMNSSSGFIVNKRNLAGEWVQSGTGRSYREMSGVLIDSLDDIPDAQEALLRQKALSKLTEKEKKALGL